jgi:hypothetical protein
MLIIDMTFILNRNLRHLSKFYDYRIRLKIIFQSAERSIFMAEFSPKSESHSPLLEYTHHSVEVPLTYSLYVFIHIINLESYI